MTLDDLPAAYAAARAVPITTDPPPQTCRYCGKHWRHWAGSKHDGHVVCVVTPEFQRELLKLYRSDPKISKQAIANVCGVTLSTVCGWLHHADQHVV